MDICKADAYNTIYRSRVNNWQSVVYIAFWRNGSARDFWPLTIRQVLNRQESANVCRLYQNMNIQVHPRIKKSRTYELKLSDHLCHLIELRQEKSQKGPVVAHNIQLHLTSFMNGIPTPDSELQRAISFVSAPLSLQNMVVR